MKKQTENKMVYHPKWSDDGKECEFIPKNIKKIIIGTMPPKKLCVNKNGENIDNNFVSNVNFFYGSARNNLWKTLSEISNNKELVNGNNLVSIRKNFAKEYHIGFADVIHSCIHNNDSSCDSELLSIKPNKKLITILKEYPNVKIFCTSKNTLNFLKMYFVNEIKEKEENVYDVKFNDIDQFFEVYTIITASGRSKKNNKYKPKLTELLIENK